MRDLTEQELSNVDAAVRDLSHGQQRVAFAYHCGACSLLALQKRDR